MILTDTLPAGNSTFDFMFQDMESFLLYSPKSYATVINNTNLNQTQIEAIYRGAPFDANNHSTARVAFSVDEYDGNYFVYNYNLFYPWNGCSNQAISLNINGQRNITNYIMCPAGVHEADWERVSVLVCKSDWQIKRMAFSQHYWAEERDCTVAGECTLDPETGHYATFAGLDSHANYPQPSELKVYDYVNGNFSGNAELDNLGGIFIGDRNNPDPYRKWVPRPELMLYIPEPGALNDTLDNETLWMSYSGNWGAPLQMPAVTLDCLNDEQTERFPCPADNESTNLILRVIKLLSGLPIGVNLGGESDAYSASPSSNSTLLGYPGITGPLNRGYSETWIARPQPMIHNKNDTTLVCPKDTPEGTPLPSVDPSVFNVSVSTLTNYLIGVAIGDVVFSVLLVLVMALPTLIDKSAKVQKMVVKEAQMLAGGVEAAAKKATFAVENFLPGTSSSATLETLGKKNSQKAQDGDAARTAAAHGDEEAGTASTSTPIATATPPPPPNSSAPTLIKAETEILNVQVDEGSMYSVRTFVWFVLGLCLFIAGIALSIYGVVETLNDSVLSAALSRLNIGSVAETLKMLLVTGLSLIGGIDIVVIFLLFFMKPERFKVGKFSIRNYLGGFPWLTNHVFELYVVSLGLVVLALCIAVFFFALGFMLTIVQVGVRLLCKGVMGVSVLGRSPLDVCISLPIFGVDRICGWEAMVVCADMTGMNVRYVMVGAILLIYSHVVWTIVLTLALEVHRGHMVVLKRKKSNAVAE
jgi:hypothetical protein